MFCGRVFHNFVAEWEKEQSNSADLGIDKMPLSVDLKAAYSVTMNIFRKEYFLFKSFAKVE